MQLRVLLAPLQNVGYDPLVYDQQVANMNP